MSIIVPVYNVERYLGRCLDSILAQTMPRWECVCVDGGSTDGCGAILDEYAARDARFVVVHKANGGVSSARNAGLDAARGEYVGFVDSDDWIESDTYELALSAARETDADLVQWGFFLEQGKKTIKTQALPRGEFNILTEPAYFDTSMCDKLVLRELICRNSLRFAENIRSHEDGIFATECCLLARRAFCVDRPLYHYVTNPKSASHNLTREKFYEGASAITMMEQAALKALSASEAASAPLAPNGGRRLLFIDNVKARHKIGTVLWLNPPDIKLARDIFPEVSRMAAKDIFYRPRLSALILRLLNWRMDFLLRALSRLWRAIRMRGT